MPRPTRTAALVLALTTAATLPARADEPVRHEGKTLDEWVAAMNDARDFSAARRHAARVVGRFGKPAIPHLTATFKADYVANGWVTEAAAGSLARIGGDDARDALVPLFRGTNHNERFLAFTTAALMHDPGKAAVYVAPWLADNSLNYWIKVRDLAPELDPAVMVPVLLEQLQSRDAGTAVRAAAGLVHFGPSAKPALDTARQLLTHKSVEVASGAAKVLGAIGPDAGVAAPDLVRAFAQPFARGMVGAYTERAVEAIGKPAVPALLADLKARTGSHSYTIAVLGRIGSPHADDAVPHLLKIVETRNPAGQVENAVLALGGFAGKGDDIAPVLLAVLTDETRKHLHYSVLRSLARLGPKAKPAAEKIAERLADKTGRDRDPAIQAALALAPHGKVCIPPLVAFLTAEYQPEGSNLNRDLEQGLPRFGADAVPELLKVFEVQKFAPGRREEMIGLVVRVLGEIGVPAKTVAPKLREIARDKKQQMYLRAACVEAVGKMRADPKEDLPLLADLLAEPEPYPDGPRVVNEAAAKAIGFYGPAAVELAPLLLKVTQPDKKRSIRVYATVTYALVALPAVGVPADTAVPRLIGYLDAPTSNEWHTAGQVAVALAKYGPKAKSAVPAARRLLDTPTGSVRALACDLLGAIGPDAREALPDLRELAFDEVKEVRAAARAAIKAVEK